MQNTKLINLVSTFSPTEWRRFKKMLQSSFFTTNPNLLALYQILKKYYPNYDNPQLSKTHLFKSIFDEKEFNENKIRMLIRDMTRLVEDFLVWENIKAEKKRYQKQLLSIYTQRGLFQWYERTRAYLLKELNNQPYRDLEYFNEIYSLDFDFFFHPATSKDKTFDTILLRLMDSVDKQFILAKYRILSEMKNRERILEKEYPIRFLSSIEDEKALDFLQDNTFFKLFSLLFELYKNKNDISTFKMLKLLFKNQIKELRRIDQSLLLTQLLNFTIRQINNGSSEFYKEAFLLYQIGIDNQLVIENQQITVTTFGNIVTVGCHSGEFEWTKGFMIGYESFLSAEIRKDTLAINQGLWYFYQKNFSAAYDLFLNHAFSANYQPKARFNLIRTIFEQFLLDNTLYSFLITQIEAYEKFLYRSTLVVKYHKNAYLHTIQILKRLILDIIKQKNPNQTKTTIINLIEKKERVIAKDWLLAKVSMLKE